MIMTISYGKGRVFHTPMGHADYSMKCVGFQDVLRRGTQWAATGKVNLDLSNNFPIQKNLFRTIKIKLFFYFWGNSLLFNKVLGISIIEHSYCQHCNSLHS